jgi:hypothetical protein
MKKLLFVLLFLFSSIVHAQWILVSESDDGQEKFFIEKKSITQINQYIRVWVKVEFTSKSIMSTNNNIRSARVYEEYDCREKKFRKLSVEFFKQPNLIDQQAKIDEQASWTFVAPESNNEGRLIFVCKNK